MTDKSIHIKFDRKTALAVREPLLNSFGFDLTNENAIGYTHGKFRFTVLGFRSTSEYSTLIATVKVAMVQHVHDEYVHVQKLNLYDNERLKSYARTGAFQLKTNQDEMSTGLYSLREKLENYRLDELKDGNKPIEKEALSAEEQKHVKEILKADSLIESIELLLKQAGIVTEFSNSVMLYLILLSRNLEVPLNVLYQGSVPLASMLTDTVVSAIPKVQLRELTSLSPSAMYYSRNKDYWKSKVLYVKEIDRQFRGSAILKEFIDNQVLQRHTTESDHITRQLYSSDKVVQGPICLVGYCNDEKSNSRFFRDCLIIRLEETKESNSRMLAYIKMEACGLINEQEQEQAKKLLRAIHERIQPLNVVIPFAQQIQLPESIIQPVQGLRHLITLIKTVALLHQHQLKKKVKNGKEYIEATDDHLQIALELFKGVSVTKSDILSPAQRSLLESIKTHVKSKDNSFKVPEVIKAMRMSKSSFYREFNELKELDYVRVCGGNKKEGIQFKITEWEDFTDLTAGAESFAKQINSIRKQVSRKIPTSFPEVSRKFPMNRKATKSKE